MSDAADLKSGAILGEKAKPPFAVLPDPSSLFLNRSRRFTALASQHDLAGYLSFLAVLTLAQHDIQAELPPAVLPPFERIGQALEHEMPPISLTLYDPNGPAMTPLERLLDRLAGIDLPPQTTAALDAVRRATRDERRMMTSAALSDAPFTDDVVSRALVLAGLQVHFARLAALLDAAHLKPVADGACPVCGSPPVTSSIVGWPRAHNTRFCSCSLCATMWNVVRVKCLLCGSMDGFSFRSVEGKPDTVKAETCDRCRGYVKVLYQVKDPSLESVADDVASVGLDMLLAAEGWKRGGHNLFLLGY